MLLCRPKAAVCGNTDAPASQPIEQPQPRKDGSDETPPAPGVQLKHLRHTSEPRQKYEVEISPFFGILGLLCEVPRNVVEDVEHLLFAQAAQQSKAANVLSGDHPRRLRLLNLS